MRQGRSTLAAHQRALAALVHGGGRPPASQGAPSQADLPATDPYLQQVAGSRHLALVREIAAWWRTLAVRRGCPLTASLLDHLGLLDERIAELAAAGELASYREEVVARFLALVASHPHPLAVPLARFERALLAARRGAAVEETIEWCHRPDRVLAAVLGGGPLPGPGGRWWTRVSSTLPGFYEIGGDGPSPRGVPRPTSRH